MFWIYGQGTLQNCESYRNICLIKIKCFNHFRVPPGAVGSKTKRIKRKRSRNILLRYVLCQVLGGLSSLSLKLTHSLAHYLQYSPPGIILRQCLTNQRSQLSPPNCRSHPPSAVAAVVLLDVFARLMLCPLWLPGLWTDEGLRRRQLPVEGSPIFQYANYRSKVENVD